MRLTLTNLLWHFYESSKPCLKWGSFFAKSLCKFQMLLVSSGYRSCQMVFSGRSCLASTFYWGTQIVNAMVQATVIFDLANFTQEAEKERPKLAISAIFLRSRDTEIATRYKNSFQDKQTADTKDLQYVWTIESRVIKYTVRISNFEMAWRRLALRRRLFLKFENHSAVLLLLWLKTSSSCAWKAERKKGSMLSNDREISWSESAE